MVYPARAQEGANEGLVQAHMMLKPRHVEGVGRDAGRMDSGQGHVAEKHCAQLKVQVTAAVAVLPDAGIAIHVFRW